jgi:hypothetical protein
MDEIKVAQMIQKALDDREVKNAFSVSLIPAHSHTGVDSSQVDGKNLEHSLPYFVISTSATAPTAIIPNAITVVGGKLYVCNGTAWVVAGTQT